MMDLEKYKDDIYTCNRTRCGFCRDKCPVYVELKYEAYSSRGKMQIARALLEGRIKPDDALMECLSACTLCGYCMANCALHNVEIFKSLREALVQQGVENKYHKKAVQSILEWSNPMGRQEGKADWAKDLSFDKNSKILFFGGCSYPFTSPKILQVIYQVLKATNVSFNYLGDEENCCGLVMELTGYQKDFDQYRKDQTKHLLELGIEKIITPCPGCYKVLKSVYFNPESDGPKIEVRHFVEFFAELVKKKKITFTKRIAKKVTWHDPCDLGRHMGLFEEPRDILRAIPGLELIEMPFNKYQAHCCGSGGGMLSSNADISIDIAIKRMEEAEATGAEALITMCPTCEAIFEKAIRYTDSSLQLFDLAEFIRDAL